MNTETLENIFSNIIEDYFNTFSYKIFDINIIITDDLWKSYFEIRPDHKEKFTKQLPSFNGTVVPPNNLKDKFTMLIDKEYLNNDIEIGHFAWVGTIAHEATHIHDYKEYLNLTNTSSFDEILDTNIHRMFHIWTEFNAKRHGYYFLRKYSFSDMKDVGQLTEIFNTEIPFQINNFVENYNSTTDGWEQIYASTQFLGRISVWKDLFPQSFTPDILNKLFDNVSWLYKMFIFLDTYRNLSDAIVRFEELRKILNKNFIGI